VFEGAFVDGRIVKVVVEGCLYCNLGDLRRVLTSIILLEMELELEFVTLVVDVLINKVAFGEFSGSLMLLVAAFINGVGVNNLLEGTSSLDSSFWFNDVV